ncbi:MAG: molybdenum cofactor biosynthesis enzyme [uncultured archaeon A07HR67]|nr:MAG: molybdenum cofactor biosynthesis enzyme [uncultured archaeon A07HR67]
MLEDSFGREMSGVRVSLTDRCNFDCVYCHNEGLGDTRGPMDPQDNEMDTDDVVRFLEVAAEFDVDSVKFTGGEPMLRDDLEEIIARTPESMEVSMTTNGTFLPGRAGGLVEAGLDRVTSHRTPSTRRSRRDHQVRGYDAVMEGVQAAVDAG